MFTSLNDFWSTHGDRFSLTLPLLGNPIAFFASLFIITLTTTKIAPMYAQRLEKYDLRPIMMIANGLIFGLFGLGFFMGMSVTHMGADGFDCDGFGGSESEDLRVISIKLIAWIYLMLKFMEFQRPLFASLRRTSNSDHYKEFGYYFYLYGQLGMSYLGASFHPGGLFAFWPILDSLVTIAAYGYLILKLASPELHPNPVWKKIITAARFMTFVALAFHGFYYASIPNCGNNILLRIQAWYNVILITSAIFDYLFKTAKSKILPNSTGNGVKQTIVLDENGNHIKQN